MRLRSETGRRCGAALTAIVAGATFAMTIGMAPLAHAATKKALIDGDTVSGSPSQEEQDAVALGFTVDVVSGAAWNALTAADFGRYDVIIAGDPFCSSIAPSFSSSEPTWAPVVMGAAGGRTQAGNRVVVGTDPVLHGASSDPARNRPILDGIDFAGSQPGRTGLYFDTSCGGNYYGEAGLAASMLQQVSSGAGTWTEDDDPPCGGDVAMIASTPKFASLHSSDLRGWGCSVHESFPTFADDWHALAVATDTASHPVCGTDVDTGLTACGEAYILIAGSDIVVTSPDISLSPPSATNPVGTDHTVTATVTTGESHAPVVGQLVTFTVTGQNSGAAGVCVPAACQTDPTGQVTFTYHDGNGAGDDTVTASFTDSSGTKQQATATKHWSSGTMGHPTISTTPSGSVPAGGTVSDSATLSGGTAPTGSIAFTLFGPGDSACATPLATRTATVAGNGSYGSGDVVATSVGTYNWTAAYSGDAGNAPVTSGCGDESVTVTKARTALSTTPSKSVPAGGKVSDSATLSGGSAPAGTLTFDLFGPGDTSCTTVIATRTATVAGNGAYGSGEVVAATAGTYNWVATYDGDASNIGSMSGCGDEKVVVTPQTLTGRAFGLSVRTALLSLSPTPDTGSIATTAAGTTSIPCVATLGGAVSAHSLCVNVTTAQNPGASTGKATVADATVGVPLLPVIKTTDAQATSTTTCAGSTGQTTIASLKVGATVVIPSSAQPAPNTTVNVGLVKVVLNEQVPVVGGLTVNAVHIIIPNAADVIIASATSDIHNCP